MTDDRPTYDQDVVDNNLAGTETRALTRPEKAAVARALTARAFTPSSIALHLGIHTSTVEKMLRGTKR